MQVFNYGKIAADAMNQFGDSLSDAMTMRQERSEAQQQKDVMTGLTDLYANGATTQELYEYGLQNPAAFERVGQTIGFKNDQTKQIMRDTLIDSLQNPEQRDQIITQGAEAIRAAGGDPRYLSQAIGDTTEDFERGAIPFLASLGDQGSGFAKSYMEMKPQQQAPNYSNVQFDESGNPYGLNKETGQYEPIQGGFKRAKPTASTVVNVGKAEGEQAKTIAKAEGENYNAYVSDAKVARTNDATLNRLEGLNEKAFDGAAAPAYKSAAKLAETVGINVDGLTETQLFDSLANQLVLGQTSKLTGVLTDKDMDLLASTVPQLSQTKEGRKQLIGIMKEMNSATKDKARLAAKFRKENGGQFDDMAFQDWLETQPKKDRFSKFASSKPSQPVIQAPQGALDYLKANPSMANQFKAKYGYLPEGY